MPQEDLSCVRVPVCMHVCTHTTHIHTCIQTGTQTLKSMWHAFLCPCTCLHHLVLWVKLLLSHASLVFGKAGLRPALFLITCFPVSVHLSVCMYKICVRAPVCMHVCSLPCTLHTCIHAYTCLYACIRSVSVHLSVCMYAVFHAHYTHAYMHTDRYTDTEKHVFKNRAGRRPALLKTREAWDNNSFNQNTRWA